VTDPTAPYAIGHRRQTVTSFIPLDTKPGAISLLRDSLRFLRSHYRDFLRIAIFPILISLLIGIWSVASESSDSSPEWIGLVIGVIDLLPWTLFGVAWHRRILRGDEVSSASVLTWTRDHTRFAAFLVFWRLPWLVLPEIDPAAARAELALIGVVGSWLVMSLLEARLAIFLPAAAIGDELPISSAWQRSRGYVVAIFLSVLMSGVVGFGCGFPAMVALFVMFPGGTVASGMAALPVVVASTLLFEALAIGALSVAYRHIGASQ
jgi:hypothetical protein